MKCASCNKGLGGGGFKENYRVCCNAGEIIKGIAAQYSRCAAGGKENYFPIIMGENKSKLISPKKTKVKWTKGGNHEKTNIEL